MTREQLIVAWAELVAEGGENRQQQGVQFEMQKFQEEKMNGKLRGNLRTRGHKLGRKV